MTTPDLTEAIGRIETARRIVPPERSVLVAITGIDGSGKGFVTAALAASLEARGHRTAVIPVDPWLHLPARRFDAADPGGHFYRRAVRFDALFHELVLPLRRDRSISLEMDCAEETATRFRRHRYAFRDVDVILLEGIFLLKRAFRDRYDASFWIDCPFDTALRRAVARSQEGLPPEETARAYHTIYFPAQRTHLERDRPREAASLVVPNDF